MDKRGNYNARRKWADSFTPLFMAITRKYIFPMLGDNITVEVADNTEDRENATDLVTLGDHISKCKRIALRVRDFDYEHFGEFTLRIEFGNAKARDKQDPELQKIIDGNIDYLISAFACPHEVMFASWVIIDMKKFRRKLFNNELKPTTFKNNTDGNKSNAYKINDVRDCVLVECVHDGKMGGRCGTTKNRKFEYTVTEHWRNNLKPNSKP